MTRLDTCQPFPIRYSLNGSTVKTINRYISQAFINTFFASLLVLTFVLSLGIIFKLTDLIARNAAIKPILVIFVTGLPSAIGHAVPFSCLATALLLFNRMSIDNEIIGMKACGVSVWNIVSRPLMFAAVITSVSLFLRGEVQPVCHEIRRNASMELTLTSPLEFLEEGRFVQDFEGYQIYIGKRRGNELTDVRIYETTLVERSGKGNVMKLKRTVREIRAKSGTIQPTEKREDLLINLHDVKIDPLVLGQDKPGYFGEWPFRVEGATKKHRYYKKHTDFVLGELWEVMKNTELYYNGMKPEDIEMQSMILSVELSKRLVLSFSCIAFVLLGAPLGISPHRKESMIRFVFGLVLAFSFYLFTMLAEAMTKYPHLRPDLIIWLPLFAAAAVGAWLIHRAD